MHKVNFQTPQSTRRPRVLMLSHRLPYPPDRGDRIRGFNILKNLAQNFDVSLACTSEEPVSDEQRKVLTDLTSNIAIHRISSKWSKAKGLTAILRRGAITPACFYRKQLANTIQKWHKQDHFDVIFTYCTSMVHYSRQIMAMKNPPRQVIDLVDVDSAKWAEYALQTTGPMGWIYAYESKQLAKIEAGNQDHFDAITVVSDAEADHYRKHVGQHPGLTTLRHAVDTDYFYPQNDIHSKTIVFVGVLNYRPNVEGITWFTKEVLPILQTKIPDVQLKIIGRHLSTQVAALNNIHGVEVIGPVDDVRTHLGQAAAAIAPLLIARGVQTKVLEAMSSARVAVCSPGAANGILADNGKHLLIADQPKQWVQHLQDVITDHQYRNTLRLAARKQIERLYPWEKCLQPLPAIIRGHNTEPDTLTTMRKSA